MRIITPLFIPLLLIAAGFSYGQVAPPGASSGPSVQANEVNRTQDLNITRSGSRPSAKAPSEYFTGAARVDPLFDPPDPTRVYGANVTFEPGARTAWHTHPLGQTLIVTAGTGLVQRAGGPVEEITAGDVVWIPPDVKHWHGAASTTAMTHTAIGERLEGKSVEWMEKVSDEEYGSPVSASASSLATANSAQKTTESRAQQLMGDIAPKLADLTDDVLYNDIWERPELSKRDRSLVTVSALVALNRPDQLRSHLRLARQNGVAEQELVEAITHLAFYSGWPNSVTAVGVAKEVFESLNHNTTGTQQAQ